MTISRITPASMGLAKRAVPIVLITGGTGFTGSHLAHRLGEHAFEWGVHAAQEAAGPSSGRKLACHVRNACSSVSFNTATRTVRNGWTVLRFHRICCRLIIRFATI